MKTLSVARQPVQGDDRMPPEIMRGLSVRPIELARGHAGWVYWNSSEDPMGVPSVLTIGHFDGVHLGHQALLDAAFRQKAGRPLGAVTFSRHPLSLVDPDREPLALMRVDDKVRHLLAAGADYVATLVTSEALLASAAPDFVDDVVVDALHADLVVVGPNFRFGHCAAGDPGMLAELGWAKGFEVQVPRLMHSGHGAVSSSRIRAEVAAGQVANAAVLLGRRHTARGFLVDVDANGLKVSFPHNMAVPSAGEFDVEIAFGPAKNTTFHDAVVTISGATTMVRDDRRLPRVPRGEQVEIRFIKRHHP